MLGHYALYIVDKRACQAVKMNPGKLCINEGYCQTALTSHYYADLKVPVVKNMQFDNKKLSY